MLRPRKKQKTRKTSILLTIPEFTVNRATVKEIVRGGAFWEIAVGSIFSLNERLKSKASRQRSLKLSPIDKQRSTYIYI